MTTQASCAIEACTISAQCEQGEVGRSDAMLLPPCPSMADIEASVEACVRALCFHSLTSQTCSSDMALLHVILHGIVM
jgi:hypothetical protein